MRSDRLHGALAVIALWLVVTSPWVSMLRRVPADAGFFDYAHLVLGWLALALGVAYTIVVTRGGQLRQYLPGRAAGLGGVIEGLLLLTFIVTGVTGALWFLTQGTVDSLAWRDWHGLAARAFMAAGIAHLLAVASHLLDL